MLTQLQTLDIKKATGPDGISACFLRSVAEELAVPLTFIFNMSIRSGSIPKAWKQSNVSPIHKGEVVMIQGILDQFLLFR